MKKTLALVAAAGACSAALATPPIDDAKFPVQIAGHVYVNVQTGERTMVPFGQRMGDPLWMNNDSTSNGNFYHGLEGATRAAPRNQYGALGVDWGDCTPDISVDGFGMAYAVQAGVVRAFDPATDPTVYGLNMFYTVYAQEQGFGNGGVDGATNVLGITDLYGDTDAGNGWIFTFDFGGTPWFTMDSATYTDLDGDTLSDFGYGYTFRQQQGADPRNVDGSGNPYAIAKGINGPFLVLPGNAGGLGTPPSAGVENAYDWYNNYDGNYVFNGAGYDFDPLNTYARSNYINSYWFGGSPYASYWTEYYGTGGANPCPADFNGDGFVDFFDYDDFVLCFESNICPPGKSADFNGDGFVDFFDYDDFVLAFETGCP